MCTSSSCCGNGCLPSGHTCCPDSTTCPSATPVCCNGGGCAADAASCASGPAACSGQDTPCAGECCSPGTPTCCSGGCAPAGSICCSNALYCSQDHPICCGSYCCDLGSTCSDIKTCVRASGALSPGTIPAKASSGGTPASSPEAGEPVSKGTIPPGSRHRAEEYGFGFTCGGCTDDEEGGGDSGTLDMLDAGGSKEAGAFPPPALGAGLRHSGNGGLALVLFTLLVLACLHRRRPR